jgi:hypothetical protein
MKIENLHHLHNVFPVPLRVEGRLRHHDFVLFGVHTELSVENLVVQNLLKFIDVGNYSRLDRVRNVEQRLLGKCLSSKVSILLILTHHDSIVLGLSVNHWHVTLWRVIVCKSSLEMSGSDIEDNWFSFFVHNLFEI